MKLRSHWWWLVLAIPLGLGLARLRFDADVLNLLPSELPVVRGLQLQQAHFANDRELLLTVSAPQPELAEHAAQTLAETLRQNTNLVVGAVWRPPWLDHPEHTAEFLAWMWLNQSPSNFNLLAARLDPDRMAERLADVREQLATSLSPMDLGRLSYDPLGLTALPGETGGAGLHTGEELFTSADGTFRLVFVDPAPDYRGFRSSAAWLEAIQALVRQTRSRQSWPAGVEIGYTGKPAFLAEAARGMERDMRSSVLSTLAIIAVLVWLVHRRLLVKVWVMVCLVVTLLATAAIGGLVLGQLNLVSMGFAAILLGLAVDYALVLYQEAAQHPQRSMVEARRAIAPAIWGSALTTALAFSLLNFSGLPGLGQLGSLVAIGVLVAAVVMQYLFLPLATRGWAAPASPQPVEAISPRPRPSSSSSSSPVPTALEKEEEAEKEGRGRNGAAVRGGAGPRHSMIGQAMRWLAVLALVWVAGILAWRGLPPVDHSTQPLSPRDSAAEASMQELLRQLDRGRNPVLLVIEGATEAEVRARLETLEHVTASAGTKEPGLKVELPLALWPSPNHQQANRSTAHRLVQQAGLYREAILEAGFNDAATHLASGVFHTWQSQTSEPGVAWPENDSSRWLLGRVVGQRETGWLALGTLSGVNDEDALRLASQVEGVTACGWQMLGEALLDHVADHVGWLVAGMILVVALCLRITLGTWTGVGLSFASLTGGLLLLLALMSLTGWSWNLMNLPALPLLLGAGVDYSIHVLHALRRHGGDLRAMHRGTGRALLLCAGTTVAAFGSLAFSSNAGLASLGQVCAAGVAAVMVSTLYLMPAFAYPARR